MVLELVVAPEAEQDIQEAYAWYELQRPGPGEEYLAALRPVFRASTDPR